MPRPSRLTAKDTEKILVKRGFVLFRQKGSHRIYIFKKRMVVIPFHGNKILHLKLIKDTLKILNNLENVN